MSLDVVTFAITLFSCMAFIKLLIPFAMRIDLVDIPDRRKTHIGNIPLVGGISIFIAIVVGMLTTQVDLNQYRGILLSMLIIVVVGIVDDHRDITVRTRIIAHIIAILLIINDGIMLSSFGWIFGGFEFKLHALSIFVTIFAVLGVMNSVNMSDGIDGLSGLNSLVAFLFIAYFSHLGGSESSLLISLLMASSLFGFLLFNLRLFGEHNRVFMGDTGTTLIGFLIAVLLITLSQGDNPVISPVTALWIMAVPVMDTVAIMFRRIKKGASPFKADREHLHHFFVRSGISDRKTLLIMVTASLCFSALGALMEVNHVAEWVSFALFLSIFFLYLYAIMHAWKVMRLVKD